MTERRKHQRRGPPAPGAQFAARNLGSDRRMVDEDRRQPPPHNRRVVMTDDAGGATEVLLSEAIEAIHGAIVDDYSNGRWGGIYELDPNDDGEEIAVMISLDSVRPA